MSGNESVSANENENAKEMCVTESIESENVSATGRKTASESSRANGSAWIGRGTLSESANESAWVTTENRRRLEDKRPLSTAASMDLLNRARLLVVRSPSKAPGREEGQTNNLANQCPNKPLLFWDMNSQEIRHSLTAALPDTDPKTKDIHQGITETPSRRTNQANRPSLGNNTAAQYKNARESEELQDPINNIPDSQLGRFDLMNHPGQDQTRSPSRCSVVSTLAFSKRLIGRAGTLHSPKLFKVYRGW